MGRSIWAIFVGLIVSALWIAVLEWINALVFPLPAELQLDDREAVAHILNEKPGMLVGVAVADFTGTLIGGWFGSRTARRAYIAHGLLIGLIVLGIGVVNLLALPHPAWFWVVSLPAFPLAGALGGWVARRNRPALEKGTP
jgi:hypothetical protein